MRTKIIALAVLLSPAASAAGEAGFGLSLASFKETARQIEIPAPARAHNGNRYFSRDCARLALAAGEGAVESELAELFSQEFIEECHSLPPNELGLIVEHCYSRPLREWSRTARLLAKPRQIPPGKKEVFEVCLEGERLELAPVFVFYAYMTAREGEESVLFTLTPAGNAAVSGEGPTGGDGRASYSRAPAAPSSLRIPRPDEKLYP